MNKRREDTVRGREPTIHDVAELAGVSIGTVSNYLNSPAKVSPATQDRVRSAIQQSGFIRNGNARSLASGTTPSVALIVPDITNTLFVDISKGAQSVALELGLSLVLANANNDLLQQDNYLDLFAEARSVGILLAPMRSSRGGVQRVRDHGRPVVLLNYEDPELDACTVLMDNEGGGRLAAAHAIDRGYERLVFVGADDVLQPVRARRKGIRAVAAEHRVSLREIDVNDLNVAGEGYQLGVRLADEWSPDDPPTVVLAVTDTLAEEVINGILSRPGMRIPRDIAVMGMDGNRMSWGTPVTMSTLTLPGFDMGATAVRLLVDERNPGHVHQRAVFPMELRARESTDSAAHRAE
ncbi:MAG TPA: LacI family DNA-binding transcriptional regulator [Galbitalea sp.]